MGRLDGKVAAITGGASGIGEATVRRFVAEGAKVGFADRDGERGRRVEAELKAQGGKVVFVEGDVSQEAIAAGFVTRTADQLGKLDILVNNAGIRMYQTVVEASAESWQQILGVNLMSYAFCAKAAVPLMKKAGKGSIVNIASVRSVTSGSKTIQYDTAKAALAGLTRGIAMDHAEDGVRCNAVCPGSIFTPFHARRIAAAGQSVEDYNADAAARCMLKRPGTADEVANCVLFLASDEASFCTGSLMFVDGGLTAM